MRVIAHRCVNTYVMDVPDDEDGLVRYIVEKFEEQKAHYEELNKTL